MNLLTIKNKKICDFYLNNPQLDCETMNLVFIELIEKLNYEIKSNLQFSLNSQILSNITEHSSKIHDLNNSITYLKDTVSIMHSDITNNILLKFNDVKHEYLSELKLILNDNTNEKIGSIMDKHNAILIDKTSLILNDIVPKTQGQYYSQIQDSLQSFHKSLTDDTKVLLKYADNNSIKDYMNNFEMKSSMMIQNIQQPIYSFVTASEDRINSNISNLKDNSNYNNNIQTKLIGELTDLISNIRKDGNSYTNPHNSNTMNIILNKLYTTSEIISLNKFSNNTMRTVGSGGTTSNNNAYIIKRHNKQKILVQSIDTENNANQEEIQEFIQNMEDNNCHGVFLSHNSGFTTKSNYHIETHNKLIMVYVHEAQYSQDKIKAAIDIIDNLFVKMRELNIDSSFEVSIDKDILEEINKEYQYFITQKDNMMNILKDSQKKMMTQLDEFKFPGLDKYLSTKFTAITRKSGLKCELCKNFNAHNLKALAAHKRGCIRKQPVNILCQQIK
jgi:hypothetical protein